ncbi:MAG: UvrD-helicase domain-containing protein [Chlorobi bacterium]|nr:UvrD-helicase domain-containing protein [Chlorobiota bacterium]
MNKLEIYKASAGSGKTWLLTLTYLKSAFETPDNFSKILAVTFTNKAAEEMKTRILEKLNALIDNGKNADYFNEISEHIKINTAADIKKKALAVRDQILHNYSAFNVNTIDSFVQRVIRAFSFEMNLNSSYDIELDQNKVIDELTEMLFNSLSENKELQNWLIQFSNSKTEESRNWDFKKDIKNLAAEIFKEHFQKLYNINAEKFNKKELSDYLKMLYQIKNSFENKMSEFAYGYKEIIEKAGIDILSLGAKFKTISNHFLTKIAKNKIYDDFTTTIIKACEGIENWYAKNAAKEIIAEINSVYNNLSEILMNYFNFFEKEHENYYTAVQIINNFHSFGIINDLAGFLPEYRSENNVLLISDTTLLLKEIIGNNDAPFIYEKIGNRYKHILIDEFQDTSGFQWENFKPLIANSLSMGYDNLIVGDIKQSVYRWRGGNWRLLLSGVKNDIGNEFIEDKTLDTNWRSRENIIKFNNAFFEILPQILQNQYNEKLESINNENVKIKLKNEHYNTMLIDAYAEHIQKVPAGSDKNGGNVKIHFIEKDNYEEELKDKFPAVIDELLKNNYKNPRDIGILVRTNKQAKEITELLTYYQNEKNERAKYKIISGDALYIENSTAVRILISAMKYINNKYDKINLTQLIFEYQKSVSASLDYNKVFLSVENEDYIKLLPEKFLNEQELFLQKELFELSEELIVIFGLTDKTQEFAYIKTFQNIITDFTRKYYSDLSEFLEHWNEKAKNTSVQISDKTDAVNVMTIHKSKGLAFDTVLIPYTNFNFDHSSYSAPILWAKIDNQPFNKIPYLPIKYSSYLSQTFFRKDYFDEMLYSYTDTINLLYVVFTRAEKELIIFSSFNIPKTKKNTSIKNTSNAMYQIVNQDIDIRVGDSAEIFNFSEYYNPETQIFDFSINHKAEKKDLIKEEKKSYLLEKKYPSNHWQNKLQLKLNSEEFFIESIPELEEKVNYGKLMHRIFQNIITIKDIDKSVMKQHSEGILTLKEAEEFILKIKNAVNKETVKSWFDGTYKVINEDALLTEKGNIRIPDRVLFSETEIVVIDFKFGKHNKKYTEQITEYKNLLKEYYGLPVKSYLYYPENNKIIEVD